LQKWVCDGLCATETPLAVDVNGVYGGSGIVVTHLGFAIASGLSSITIFLFESILLDSGFSVQGFRVDRFRFCVYPETLEPECLLANFFRNSYNETDDNTG